MQSTQVERRATWRVDIAVRSADGKLQLVAEVKNRAGADAAWAAQTRRDLAVHAAIPEAPFFLLALPDHLFLWHNVHHVDSAILPNYDVDPVPFLAPYVGEDPHALVGLSGESLQMAVSAWISGLVSFGIDQSLPSPHRQWLIDSGMYDAIRGGIVLVDSFL
jgi:hypothetical protein